MDIVHPMETQLKHKCDASGQKMPQTNPFQVASLLSSFAHFSSCCAGSAVCEHVFLFRFSELPT